LARFITLWSYSRYGYCRVGFTLASECHGCNFGEPRKEEEEEEARGASGNGGATLG